MFPVELILYVLQRNVPVINVIGQHQRWLFIPFHWLVYLYSYFLPILHLIHFHLQNLAFLSLFLVLRLQHIYFLLALLIFLHQLRNQINKVCLITLSLWNFYILFCFFADLRHLHLHFTPTGLIHIRFIYLTDWFRFVHFAFVSCVFLGLIDWRFRVIFLNSQELSNIILDTIYLSV